jgi:hypothetical protein
VEAGVALVLLNEGIAAVSDLASGLTTTEGKDSDDDHHAEREDAPEIGIR